MSIVYIAGKMTGLPDKGRARFREVEAVLKADGHTVLNPAVLPDTLAPQSYMPICLAMIDAADTLLLLDNWKDSPGAKLERRYAKYQKKAIWELVVEAGGRSYLVKEAPDEETDRHPLRPAPDPEKGR